MSQDVEMFLAFMMMPVSGLLIGVFVYWINMREIRRINRR